MNQDSLRELQKSSYFKEFADFIELEAIKLNRLDDLQVKGEQPLVVAVQVSARQEAYKVLKKILDPLINYEERATITSGEEYAVDVE